MGDRKQAILATYQHCATPTLQAALISGLGLSIFAFSTFTPTQRFGCLMLVILWAGAIAELIYFPALLAGPLGMVFKPRKRPAGETEPAHASPPQLQIVHHEDEPSDETVVIDPASGNGHAPAPHTGKTGVPPQVRKDLPHGR